MIRRSVIAFTLAAATLAPVASFAAPEAATITIAPKSKAKMVKITIKNASSSPMDLTIDDKTVTIAAKGESTVNAPEGTTVYGADKSVKLVMTRDLNGGSASFAN